MASRTPWRTRRRRIHRSVRNAPSPKEETMNLHELHPELVVIDCETTGLDPTTDRIIEIASVKYRWNQTAYEVVDVYNTLIRYAGTLPPRITEITGITEAMLLASGIAESAAATQFHKRFVEGLVGTASVRRLQRPVRHQLLQADACASRQSLSRGHNVSGRAHRVPRPGELSPQVGGRDPSLQPWRRREQLPPRGRRLHGHVRTLEGDGPRTRRSADVSEPLRLQSELSAAEQSRRRGLPAAAVSSEGKLYLNDRGW
ncbi:MAG: 3'-5' exonuclease [Sphingobacterium sp.]|nr:3'-5' exonuclease [Sphingobacterium sp.]